MTTPDFTTLLDLYANTALASMVKARGVFAKQTKKSDLLAALARVVNDPASVGAAFKMLEPGARFLLSLLRGLGGQAKVGDLKLAASRAGLSNFDSHLHEIMRLSLVLYATPGSTKHELWTLNSSGYGYGWKPNPIDAQIVGVPAALALAEEPMELPPPAQGLEPLDGAPATVQEQSPSALLQGLFITVRWAGQKARTVTKTTGTLGRNDLKALAKQLGQDEQWAFFVVGLALSTGLLRLANRELVVRTDTAQFFDQTPREQVRAAYKGWLKLSQWSEFLRIPEIATSGPASGYDDLPMPEDLLRARAFLMATLKRALQHGTSPSQWHTIASLAAIVKAEDLEFLIPRQRRNQFYYYGSRQTDEYTGFWKRGANAWDGRFDKSIDWERVEGRYIRQVLAEPLRWLGLVAVGADEAGEIMAFRLTPLGLAVLELESAAPEAAGLEMGAAAETGAVKPLVVQPNFEIIAYTDPEHLRVLYELERFAERISAERVAHYRVTRDSFYRGLQEGLHAAPIKEFLERHSRSGVPQNVAYTLDDWQRVFDRVQVRRAALLLEAGSAEELDAVLAQLPEGAAERLAPTWARLDRAHEATARQLLAKHGATALDYSLEVESAFTVTNDLYLAVPPQHLDLWLDSRLRGFAEAHEPDAAGWLRFGVTRESLQRAEALGWTPLAVLEFLRHYGAPPLPPDVELTLRGWGGAIPAVALAPVTALVVGPGVMEQIVAVDELRALLWLRVDDKTALVKPEHTEALRAALERRGIPAGASLGQRLRSPGKPSVPDAHRPMLPAHRRVALLAAKKAPLPPAVGAHPKDSEVEFQRNLTVEGLSELLEDAIDAGQRVVIDYQSKAQRAARKIDPVELVREYGNLYLAAWDHWRKDYRIFRVDRILGFALTDERFDPKKHDEAEFSTL